MDKDIKFIDPFFIKLVQLNEYFKVKQIELLECVSILEFECVIQTLLGGKYKLIK